MHKRPVEPRLPADQAAILKAYKNITGADLKYIGKEPFPKKEGINMRLYQGLDGQGDLHTVYALVRAPKDFGTPGVGLEASAPKEQQEAMKEAKTMALHQ